MCGFQVIFDLQDCQKSDNDKRTARMEKEGEEGMEN